MDADNRVIPIVEDDQGEGMKDPLESLAVLWRDVKIESEETYWEALHKTFQRKQSRK